MENFYEFLGISPEASQEELENCFQKNFTPFENLDLDVLNDPELSKKVLQLRSWLRFAFDTLCDPNSKEAYNQREVEKIVVQEDKQRIQIEMVLLQSLRELETNNFDNAITLLSNAEDQHPTDGLIKGYLGWALFRRYPEKYVGKAKESLDRALEHHSDDPYLWYFRGQIHRQEKNLKHAEWCFSQAISLDPSSDKLISAYTKVKTQVQQTT